MEQLINALFKMKGRYQAVVVLLLMGVFYGLAGITVIQPGYVALKVKMLGAEETLGVQEDQLTAGTRWVEPFIYDVIKYDTRLTQYTTPNNQPMESQTMDYQDILVDLSFEIGLDGKKILK